MIPEAKAVLPRHHGIQNSRQQAFCKGIGADMKRYYGFDLGDAESAVALSRKSGERESGYQSPEILPIGDVKSFITAYARKTDGTLLIGEDACYATDITDRGLRFKSRFLTDERAEGDVRIFASGVLSSLTRSGFIVPDDRDDSFYIGCPAGWGKDDRERYRSIFERSGFPPVKIVSESRAALIAACQSRYLQVGYDILSKPVLVVDIGSSTTDFAYVERGMEEELQTAGEVALGGGLMDQMLLDMAVEESPDRDLIRQIFEEKPAWRTYCEFSARRLKEKYFSDEDYWKDHSLMKTVQILKDGQAIPLTLSLDSGKADRLLGSANVSLSGRSFREVFQSSYREVLSRISGHAPELVLLTGGVSAMRKIREWCRSLSPDAVVITGREPQFSVARGLAYSGLIDEDMRQFRKDVGNLIESTTVEKIVSKHIDELYHDVVETMTEPIVDCAVMNVFERWKSGEIRLLTDVDEELKTEIDHYMRSEDAQKLLAGVVSRWMKPAAYELEDYTMPICAKHNVPFRALNLTSYLSVTDISLRIETKNVFGLDEITWMINGIISILVGMLCGGSGIALIAGGLKGIVAGTVLSLMVLLLGKEKMEQQMMKLDLPKAMRKLVSRKQFEFRIHRAVPEIKAKFLESLERDKSEEISGRLTKEISGQIEQCLLRMAEIVEIPLG